jgi:predicted DCC family thiol-disulfide oxidoreductase YuxK
VTAGGGSPPVLLYDGACGLCSHTVQLVLRHDRGGHLRFAPLDGAFASSLRGRHPSLAAADSVVWVEPSEGPQPERLLTRSDAALRVAAYLGGIWRLATVARVVPRRLRDAAYDLVARHRHHLAAPACVVPSPAERARFLE